MEELKKAKLLRFIFRLAFFLIGIVLPCVLMITHFELFKHVERSYTRITFYGFIVCFIIFILLMRYKKQLYDWINKWEYSYMKYALLGISKVWFYLIILVIILVTKTIMLTAANEAGTFVKETITNIYSTIEYCTIVICACECVAYLIIYPIENKYDAKVQRLLRKQERIEDYREAAKDD